MSISVNKLTEKINESSARTTISELDLLQLQLAANSISQVYSVASSAVLPAAANNKGRMIFVTDVGKYFVSDGTSWSDDFSTNMTAPIWSWGYGSLGQLGTGTAPLGSGISSPVSVVGRFTDWCQVAASYNSSFGLRTNGTIWSWGHNPSGRLGDGTTVDKSSPVSVIGGFTDWCQVSAGNHTAGIRANGTLWTWSGNASGQLGDGTTVDKSSPVSVIGGFTDWCQVAVGNEHSLAIRTNGTLWTWGNNTNGKLGDNSSNNFSSPVSVVGGFTDWCQVSAGRYHSAAVRQNGTLWTWGRNAYGASGVLGDGTTVQKSSPVSVIGGFTDWCQVSAGVSHTAAVRQNGTLWTWGCNQRGRLGDGTTTDTSSPVSVIGGFTDWCQVSLGCASFSFAVRTNGTLWGWGFGGDGRLGDGTTTDKSSPVSVVGGFTNWNNVAIGSSHVIAINKVGNRGF